MSRPQIAILAAGRGTRLGRPHPKPLTQMRDGRTIHRHQLDHLAAVLPQAQIYVVVGFKLEMIMEAQPEQVFVYNEAYDETNTSQSLLRALRASGAGGVLWMNGDVVFDPSLLARTLPLIEAGQSFITVNTAAVGEEEVKYTVDDAGWINRLSKQVPDGLGEAIGVNYVAAADKPALLVHLAQLDDQDYFERGIELAIERDGLRFAPLDVSDLDAVEVDTVDDLARANASLRPAASPTP